MKKYNNKNLILNNKIIIKSLIGYCKYDISIDSSTKFTILRGLYELEKNLDRINTTKPFT